MAVCSHEAPAWDVTVDFSDSVEGTLNNYMRLGEKSLVFFQFVVFGVEDLRKAVDLCFVFIDKVNVTKVLNCEIRETLHSKTIFTSKTDFSHPTD